MASASTVTGNKQYIPMKKLDEKQGSGGKGNRPKMDYNRSVSFVRRLNIVQKKKALWISERINKRVCKDFISSKPQDSETDLCQCGYQFREHTPDAQQNAVFSAENNTWQTNINTLPQKTDAFGDIEFQGYSNRRSKYVRVEDITNMETMVELMETSWSLDLPNLLISVTGGAKDFQLTPKLKEVFNRGLMKSATSTGAWIITGGMHAGVMKLIGEAVHGYTIAHGTKRKITVIGVCPWGCVFKKKSLVGKKNKGRWPARYTVKEAKNIAASAIDPNHSHFIMVDNGTQHKFATEIAFRANLEKTISEKKTEAGNVSIPIVCVCLEGGPGTLETVQSAISVGTPAVIVEGSGRAADILAYAYSHSEDMEIEATDPNGQLQKEVIPIVDECVWEDVRKLIIKEFGNNNVDKHLGWVKECIQHRGYMTVYRVEGSNSAKDIDIAILQALLKVNKGSALDQLRLALAWKRVDIAKSHIFIGSKRWESADLEEVMFTALRKDCVDFVKLFLDNGLSLKEFLTKKMLQDLYGRIPPNSILATLLDKKKKEREKDITLAVYSVIQDLTGNIYRPKYERNDEELEDGQDFTQPEKELFFWAILLNRKEMALLFWDEGKDGMAAILIAQKITQSMSQKTADTELQKELLECAEHYGTLSVGVLNECYSMDEKKAGLLLVREMSAYSDTTVLLLAVAADNKTFTAHAACQTHLTSIWYGRVMSDLGHLKMWFCILLPIFIPFIVNFRPETDLSFNSIDSESHEMNNNKRKSTSIEKPRSNLNFFQKYYYFYNSPMITFTHNCIFYVLFLLLYSYILLTDFNKEISVLQYVLIGWVTTIMTEEFRQLATNEASGIGRKIWDYITDFWNFLDIFTILLFIAGVVLQVSNCDDCFEASRVVLAINLMTFFFRILHIFSVHKELGPKLVMIGRMMLDLMFFMVILLVFIVAFGVASQAILYPNSELDFKLIRSVLSRPYWQIYGELFLEEIEGENECSSDPLVYEAGDLPRCVANTWVVPILLGIYILITNVLMLNLLIAMFSYTFEHVQVNTDAVWKTQHYHLVREYHNRPWLAPPLIILSHIFMVFRYLLQCCDCYQNKYGTEFRRRFDESDENQLMTWEIMNTDEFLRKNTSNEQMKMENQVTETTEKVMQISTRVDELTEEMHGPTGGSKIPAMLDDRITYLEQQMNRTAKQLDFLVQCMSGSKTPPDLPKIDSPEEARKKREELLKNENDKFAEKLRLQAKIHQKSRSTNYPTVGNSVRRFVVPDDKVSWNMDFPEYHPVKYTDPKIVGQDFADRDLFDDPMAQMPFNEIDNKLKIDRRSSINKYSIMEGFPLNPNGRTGIIGRGSLGRWGPNHTGDAVLTRWERKQGKIVMDPKTQKNYLEFVAVKRQDCSEWAIPGEFQEAGETIDECLARCFVEEALGMKRGTARFEQRKIAMTSLFDRGVQIHKGYVDDHRNTDNAWIETTAKNYHTDTNSLEDLEIIPGEGISLVDWQRISSQTLLYANHKAILQLVAEKHNASF